MTKASHVLRFNVRLCSYSVLKGRCVAIAFKERRCSYSF